MRSASAFVKITLAIAFLLMAAWLSSIWGPTERGLARFWYRTNPPSSGGESLSCADGIVEVYWERTAYAGPANTVPPRLAFEQERTPTGWRYIYNASPQAYERRRFWIP